MRRHVLNALAIGVLVGGAPPAASAATTEEVSFSDRLMAHGVPLVLNGVGLLRYRIFIKVYVAALYLGENIPPNAVLADVPKRLEIEYLWEITGSDFAKTTESGIARNVDADTFAQLRPRIAELNTLYQDVEPGDRYALTYTPGVGTELALNGEPKGTIEGTDFAAAVFAIWLGRNPLDESLKDGLLSQ